MHRFGTFQITYEFPVANYSSVCAVKLILQRFYLILL